MRKFLKYLLVTLLTLFLFWIISNIIFMNTSGHTLQFHRLEKMFFLSMTITLSSLLYVNKHKYYIALITIGSLYSSVIILFLITGSQAPYKYIAEFFIFSFAIANTILLISSLIKNKYFNSIFIFIIAFILAIPTMLFMLYYSIYKTLFTTDSIIAIIQTNTSEAAEFISTYINFSSILFLFICLLSILYITYFSIRTSQIYSAKNKLLSKFILLILSIITIVIGSNNILTEPYINFNVIHKSYGKYIQNESKRKNIIKENLLLDTKSNGIYVLVIGETHNKLYTTPYGYKVNSTPWLEHISSTNKNFLLFNNAYACYPLTIQALSYALTLKNQYNSLSIENAPSLIEIANLSDYTTVWISNQSQFSIWDAGVSLIASQADKSAWVNNDPLHVTTSKLSSGYDENVLPKLKELHPTKKMLIIIHLYGSHANYKDRYPSSFEKFSNLKNKDTDEYVNSVYYNDHIMKEIYEYVKTLPNFKAMIYFSDHSETIGLGHTPTNFKPEMVCIPMYMYFSDSYIKEYPKEFAALKKAQDYTFTNDLITNTMLSIMHIKLKNYYEPDNDLANPEYNHDFTRFRTLYGRAPLTDWHTLKPE